MTPKMATDKVNAPAVSPERKEFYAGTERMTFKRIQCCKCWHVGQKLECRGCGHHICLGCKEPK